MKLNFAPDNEALRDGKQKEGGSHVRPKRSDNPEELPPDRRRFGRQRHLTATSNATVLVFSRRTLESLATRSCEVARALWALTARSLDHAEDHMLLLGRKTAAERVAAEWPYLPILLGRKTAAERVAAEWPYLPTYPLPAGPPAAPSSRSDWRRPRGARQRGVVRGKNGAASWH